MRTAAAILALGLLAGTAAAEGPPTTKSQVKIAQPPAPGPAQPAQGGLGVLGLGGGSGPVEISSDDGLEWHQTEQVYVAHGNVVVTRGDRSLHADTVFAYYRPVKPGAKPAAKPTDPTAADSGTEIWRVVADGHVLMATPTQSVTGDHGVDDLDAQVVVVTGQNLKLTTPQDVVTARDSLEWYDGKRLAVARGDAWVVRADKGRKVHGDTLVAQVIEPQGQPARISRVDGSGHVVVTGPTQTGTGDKGVYDADNNKATLIGHVKLVRGENILVGDYGVMDMATGVSRLMPRPAGAGTAPQVQGYLVPRQKDAPAKPAGNAAAPQTPAPVNPSAAPAAQNNPQGDADKPR